MFRRGHVPAPGPRSGALVAVPLRAGSARRYARLMSHPRAMPGRPLVRCFAAGFACVLALAAAAPAIAQAPAFHHPIPPSSDWVARKDIAYLRSGGADVLMDVYLPASLAADDRLPVLVFVNTITGRSQRGDGIYLGWAKAATAAGLVAVLADAAEDFGAGFDALLAHLAAHDAELRIDPGRLAVFAASGNVSRALPVLEDPSRLAVNAAVVYYGSAEVSAFRLDLPVLFVRAGLDRPGVSESLDALIAAAIRANAPVQVVNHAGGHHAFEMRDDSDATRAVIDRTLRFVREATEPRFQASIRAGIPEARAAAAVLAGDFDTAAAIYADLVAARPDDATLGLSYGEALLGAGRYGDARARFERLKDAGLGRRDLGLPAARAALADGDPEDAVAWLRTIPKRFLPRGLADDPDFAALRGRKDFEALFE